MQQQQTTNAVQTTVAPKLTLNQYIRTNDKGQPVTTSRDVAVVFNKRHYNVIRDIQGLECSKDFTDLNFELSTYQDSTGRTLPYYEITRDGFTFLAMGFTGKKAATFKEQYIAAFNAMEQKLMHQQVKLPSRLEYAQMLVQAEQDKQKLLTENLELEDKVVNLSNKTEFLKDFEVSDKTFTITEAAKMLHLKPKIFMKVLRSKYILVKPKKVNFATQRYVNAGYFVNNEVVAEDLFTGKKYTSFQTRVTPKGLIWLKKLLDKGDFGKFAEIR